jgi:hypothetical protein
VRLPIQPHWLAGALFYLGATSTTHAQAWDDRMPNVIAVGFGGTAGGVGARYLRQLNSIPLAVGAGLGVLGPAFHVDLTIPGLEFGSSFGDSEEAADANGYFGVGLLVVANRTNSHFGGGELLLEGGTQIWPRVGGDWFFLDGGLGVMIRVWGTSDNWKFGPSVRLQVGYAF